MEERKLRIRTKCPLTSIEETKLISVCKTVVEVVGVEMEKAKRKMSSPVMAAFPKEAISMAKTNFDAMLTVVEKDGVKKPYYAHQFNLTKESDTEYVFSYPTIGDLAKLGVVGGLPGIDKMMDGSAEREAIKKLCKSAGIIDLLSFEEG